MTYSQSHVDALRESLESAEAEIREQDDEISRLRAELEEARRVSDEWAKAHGARSAETSIARDEIDRLRAELGYEELGRQNDRETAQIAMDSLNATIARVRSVLDNYRPEPFGPMLSDAIRAALGKAEEEK